MVETDTGWALTINDNAQAEVFSYQRYLGLGSPGTIMGSFTSPRVRWEPSGSSRPFVAAELFLGYDPTDYCGIIADYLEQSQKRRAKGIVRQVMPVDT